MSNKEILTSVMVALAVVLIVNNVSAIQDWVGGKAT